MQGKKIHWKMSYSVVLLINVVYILVFYLLMEVYS